MHANHWDWIRELFEEVSHLPREARGDRLQQLCPGDPEVQREVLSLLAHDERAEASFLKPREGTGISGDGSNDAALGPDSLVGSRVGKYLVRRVIARGGMGAVYEAEQEHPRRTVALKVLHYWAWSRAARRRFEFEVQVLARLTHPHIAQIHDAGSIDEGPLPKGTPYFVMEYVPTAKSITDHAREQNLNVTERLALFLQACEAVQYGHQKGIIHRDLKPANILVSATNLPQSPLGKGEGSRNAPHQGKPFPAACVKVIDFGVAKATDSDVAATTMHTEVGQLIGTLTYMSPEQCAADPLGLDVRCDVYSLGVVLYQLLCGRLPYSVPQTNLTQAARVICEEPPLRPSSVDCGLRRDLEAILLKSLEKDRGRRYQSVADLARDIRRYLNREPVEARTPNVWNQAARWIGRHPLATTTFGTGVIAIFVLLTAWIVFRLAYVRPHELIRSSDQRDVRLLSISGRELHTWQGPGGCLSEAKLVPASAAAGTPMLAVLGFKQDYPGELRGFLCAFDVQKGNYEIPLWRDQIEPWQVPVAPLGESGVPRRGFTASDFRPERVFEPQEVFPESPGLELITTFAHPYSRRAIRIYSLHGELLYQAWHDGGISSAIFLPEAGLLVLGGENAETPLHELGFPASKNHEHPLVVFALRLTYGEINLAYLDPSGHRDSRIAWYKALCPREAGAAFFHPIVQAPGLSQFDDGAHVGVGMRYTPDEQPWVSFVLEQIGEIVPNSYIRTDNYNRLRDTLPLGIEDVWLIDYVDLASGCEGRSARP